LQKKIQLNKTEIVSLNVNSDMKRKTSVLSLFQRTKLKVSSYQKKTWSCCCSCEFFA